MKLFHEVRAYLVWTLTPLLLLVAAEALRRAIAGPLGALVAMGMTLALSLTATALFLRLRDDEQTQATPAQDSELDEPVLEVLRHSEQVSRWFDAGKPRFASSEFFTVAPQGDWTVVFHVKDGEGGSRRIVAVNAIRKQSQSARTWGTLLEPIKRYGHLLQDLPADKTWRQQEEAGRQKA